jgi:hypothetical protein
MVFFIIDILFLLRILIFFLLRILILTLDFLCLWLNFFSLKRMIIEGLILLGIMRKSSIFREFINTILQIVYFLLSLLDRFPAVLWKSVLSLNLLELALIVVPKYLQILDINKGLAFLSLNFGLRLFCDLI